MGLTRLNKSFLLGCVLVLGSVCSSFAQSPTTTPTTTLQNDFEVTGNTFCDGNLTVKGTQTVTGGTTFTGNITAPAVILTGTSFNGTLKVISTLAQATTFTFPDATSATDTIATLKAANTFTGVNTFPTGGIVLKGTSFNGTLLETAALGQATSYTLPDPGAASATLIETTGNANGQVAKARIFNVPVLTVPTVAGTTYTAQIAPGRACTIQKISIGAHVKPTVATTVTIATAGTTLLSTANIDASSVISSADVSVPLTLTGTGANLILTNTGTVTITWVAAGSGTQATAPVVSVEALMTDY